MKGGCVTNLLQVVQAKGQKIVTLKVKSLKQEPKKMISQKIMYALFSETLQFLDNISYCT